MSNQLDLDTVLAFLLKGNVAKVERKVTEYIDEQVYYWEITEKHGSKTQIYDSSSDHLAELEDQRLANTE